MFPKIYTQKTGCPCRTFPTCCHFRLVFEFGRSLAGLGGFHFELAGLRLLRAFPYLGMTWTDDNNDNNEEARLDIGLG